MTDVAAEAYQRHIKDVELGDVLKADDPVLAGIAASLAREAEEAGVGGRLYVESLRNQACVHILRRYANVIFREPGRSGGLSRAQCQLLNQDLEENLDRNLSLAEIAAVVHLSVFHFTRKFHTEFGCPPHAYVMRKRIERAMETGFLEAFLRPNVEVVSVKDNPIERGTPNGLKLKDGTEYAFDILIFATGFDAGTGALTRIDIRGRDGRSLKEDWARDIRTTMGLQVHGYPNLFTTAAPLAPSAALCNMTTCLQESKSLRADERGRGRLDRAPRADFRPDSRGQDKLLVHGVQRRGQASAVAVVYRRRWSLPAEMRRGRSKRLRGLRDALSRMST